MADATESFSYTELLPLGPDETQYRLVTTEGVSTFETPAGTFLHVEPAAITTLTAAAMHDIAHFLRPATSPSCARCSTIRRPATTTASSPSTC